MKKKIFLTGATGCVGHYIFDQLVKNPEYELYLLCRSPQNMRRDLNSFPNVKVVQAEMANIKKQAELLQEMDYVIHLAVCWGTTELNFDYTIDLFNSLSQQKCQKVIYFSTASILDRHNQLVPGLDRMDASYIRSKSLCHQALPQLRISEKIITLYPTWVLGGDKNHPYSHASQGIISAIKWLWLVRFFSFDLSFHFIHAQDIAKIVAYLLDHDVKEKNLVLGNQLITAKDFIKQFCQYFGQKVYFQINIPLAPINFLATLLGKPLSAWDRFCLKKRHFKHQTVNAKTFGLSSNVDTVPGILKVLVGNG